MESQAFDDLTRKLATGISRRSVLKGMFGTTAAILAGTRAGSTLAGASKTGVCHYTGSGTNPWQYIDIADAAVQTHLDHGDDLYELGTSIKHCGVCGNTCVDAPANGSPACIEGRCDFTCNAGYEPDGNGACVPIESCDQTCVDPHVLNSEACECACSIESCVEPHVLDGCACVCDVDSCPEGSTLNPDTCNCDPDTTCEAPETKAKCEEIGGIWNDSDCTCAEGCDPDGLGKAACDKNGGTWNPEDCSCTGACPPKGASKCEETGGTWDAETCNCIDG